MRKSRVLRAKPRVCLRLPAITLCLAALVGSILAAEASARPSTEGAPATQKCASGHSTSEKLGAEDFKLIQGFIVCLGKQWATSTADKTDTGGGDGGFQSLGGFSDVIDTLNSFGNDPRSDATAQFITARLNPVTATHAASCYGYTYGDTAPTAPTLASIASDVDDAHSVAAKDVKRYQGGWLRTTAIVEHGAWFHDGSPNNVRYAVVFAESDPRAGSGVKFAC